MYIWSLMRSKILEDLLIGISLKKWNVFTYTWKSGIIKNVLVDFLCSQVAIEILFGIEIILSCELTKILDLDGDENAIFFLLAL